MRAAIYTRTGPARDVLSIGNLERPEPGPGDVRVRIAWSGVNPSDVKSRAGTRTKALPFARITPHSDGSGVIDAVGAGVDPARIGERVWLWNTAWGRPDGTAAQWVVVPEEQAVRLPDGVPLEVGALLGIPALTAYHAVHLGAGVEARRVLVAGGAGAVGHYAVQMAKLAGASQVIATVSTAEKARLAHEAGADACILYREQDVAEAVAGLTGGAGVDRVIEVDYSANAGLDFEVLATGGEVVVYGSAASECVLPFVPAILKNASLHFFIVYHLSSAHRRQAIDGLTSLLAAGRLQHNIAFRLPLESIVEAHEMLEQGRAVGNVVLDLGLEEGT